MHPRMWLAVGGILGAAGVAAGAFGSHGLQGRLSPERLATWEIAVRYQIYHALALGLLGVLATVRPTPGIHAAGVFFTVGTLIFSGCLYALCLSGWKILGVIVPIGGVALIIGWCLLAIIPWRMHS